MTSFSPATNNVGGSQTSPFGIGQHWRHRSLVPLDTPDVQRQLLDRRVNPLRFRSRHIRKDPPNNARKTLRLVIPSAISRTQNSAGGRPSAPCSLAYRNTVQWEEGVPWRLKRRIRASARTWRTFWIKL